MPLTDAAQGRWWHWVVVGLVDTSFSQLSEVAGKNLGA
jgi:hypothetical protein